MPKSKHLHSVLQRKTGVSHAGASAASPALKPKWPHDSAGACMTTRIPRVLPGSTLRHVHEVLRRDARRIDTLNYVYVVDDHHHLVGVFSVKDIFRHAQTQRVESIMTKAADIITVKPATDREHAAYHALHHNLKSIPVVDEHHVLLGAISSKQLMHIVYQEGREDMLRMAGVHPSGVIVDNVLELSSWQSFWHRIPWLLLGLFGGLIAAHIVGSFERTLEKNIVLAAFIPLIVYMADAVGTQMEAFAIRDLSVAKDLNYMKYFLKQLGIVLIIAVVSSVLLLGTSFALNRNFAVASVLAIALFCATVSSVLTGVVIPFIFSKCKMDPANASGPIATIIQDILSVAIYFYVASLIL